MNQLIRSVMICLFLLAILVQPDEKVISTPISPLMPIENQVETNPNAPPKLSLNEYLKLRGIKPPTGNGGKSGSSPDGSQVPNAPSMGNAEDYGPPPDESEMPNAPPRGNGSKLGPPSDGSQMPPGMRQPLPFPDDNKERPLPPSMRQPLPFPDDNKERPLSPEMRQPLPFPDDNKERPLPPSMRQPLPFPDDNKGRPPPPGMPQPLPFPDDNKGRPPPPGMRQPLPFPDDNKRRPLRPGMRQPLPFPDDNKGPPSPPGMRQPLPFPDDTSMTTIPYSMVKIPAIADSDLSSTTADTMLDDGDENATSTEPVITTVVVRLPPLKKNATHDIAAGKLNPCNLPLREGPCLDYYPSYGFVRDLDECQFFVYGGCDGNDNRFDSLEECEEYCDP